MKRKDDGLIKAVREAIEANEPDISTERLMAMTTDICRMQHIGKVVDCSDVADALIRCGDSDETKS